MDLKILPQELAVLHRQPAEAVPEWVWQSRFLSVTRTEDELSIFCDAAVVPPGSAAIGGWRSFYVAGTIDLELPGILSALAFPLAARQISIFSISTHDTDYMVVRDHQLDDALEVLRRAGHRVIQ